MMVAVLATILLLLCYLAGAVVNEELQKKLAKGKAIAEGALQRLWNEWQIDKFPAFLKSCSMHKSSYELLKLKFMERILQADPWDGTKRKPFVISFLGSSVAAGHDSHFNYSYPVVVGDMMSEALSALDINLDSRNMALGNNPCFPYDICVRIFASDEADIIHWEQTYNCAGKPILEQFVRQAMHIPTKPLIVFSESFTAHWAPDKCLAYSEPKASEMELLQLVQRNHSGPGVLKVVSEMNKDEFKRAWHTPLGDISRTYRAAGIQAFTHMSHEKYACQGPYIKDWEKGAAAWHPSIVAHRLRAAHHAYFWLVIWRDALQELLSLASHRPVDDMLKTATHKISLVHPPRPPDRLFPSPVADNVKCYSDYEPRGIREASLKAAVVGGLAPSASEAGWKPIIYENLVHENLVKSAIKMGYKDFKHLLYADGKASGALSLLLEPQKEGPLFFCETPGIWGSLPEGFAHLWEAQPKVYLTLNVDKAAARNGWKFDAGTAKDVTYSNSKELEICVQAKDPVPAPEAGKAHVLTLEPSSDSKIILAWVIVA